MGPPPAPDGYTWSLTLLYAVTAVAVLIRYYAAPLVRGSQGAPTRLVAVVSVAAPSGLRAGDLGQRGRQSAVTLIPRISPGRHCTKTSMGRQHTGQSS